MKPSRELQNTRAWMAQLDHPDPAERRQALQRLAGLVRDNVLSLPVPGGDTNLHMHTVYSFNAEGYTPARFAWRARETGLAAAGIVDFDVLDGLEEFLAAGRLLGLRAVVGMETRVFVPEFRTRVLNSPGEPGISYHMGAGFTRHPRQAGEAAFLEGLKHTAQQRNRDVIDRVNAFLAPLGITMETDVLPLTPAGNATERHVCLAYARAAARRFPRREDLERFWTGKLGPAATGLDYPDGPRLQALLRTRTMKRGGPGYVPPAKESFPTLEDMNRFVLSQDALPVMTWLDGSSEGEQALDEWLDLCRQRGVLAVNVIPDRNYTPGVEDVRLERLRDLVAQARRRALPLMAGTEMNSPGQKFVDAFDSAELAPFREDFLQGARLLFGHTVLQSAAGMGYVSAWAREHFPERAARNVFYARAGAAADPGRDPRELALDPGQSPDEVVGRISPPP